MIAKNDALPVEDVLAKGSSHRQAPNARTWTTRLGIVAAALIPVLLASGSVLRQDLDSPDHAQHLMGGIFFADFYRDLPLAHPVEYAYQYYRQYPALGFTFWPPLFYVAEGGVMQVSGVNFTGARLTLMLFAVVMAVFLQLTMRHFVGDRLALLTVAVTMSQPVLFKMQNIVMLEIPSLAMILAVVYFYARLVRRGHWTGFCEALLLALLGSAAVYAKQTAVFLFPALLLDLCLCHRQLLKSKWTWISAALLVACCLPLAVFTFKFGAVNLAQSIGSQGGIYVAENKVAERWSIAGWTYYLREGYGLINPILLGLLTISIVAAVRSPDFRSQGGVWLCGVAVSYFVFSYLDNKQPRFLIFLIPLLVAAGVHGTYELLRSMRHGVPVLSAALALVMLAQARANMLFDRPGFENVGEIVTKSREVQPLTNIVYFGDFRQVFVPYVRLGDPERKTYVLQGDDIVRDSTIAGACLDFQARLLFVESESPDGRRALAKINQESDAVELAFEAEFKHGHRRFPLSVYAYRGPLAQQMSEVPLRSEVQALQAEDPSETDRAQETNESSN